MPVNLRGGSLLAEKVIGSILPKKLRNVQKITRKLQATPVYSNNHARNQNQLLTPSKSTVSLQVDNSYSKDVEV